MKESWFLMAALIATSVLVGCSTPDPPGVERGPHNTIAYDVLVEASEPGARIEADGNNLGNTPVHLKIYGDRDGTFHDFGSYSYVIRAYPLTTNQFSQVRIFGTGKGFQREDKIPQSVYFDMNQKPPPYPTGVDGGIASPGYYYYEGPNFYWGPSFYYGPRYRYYYGPHRYYRRY